MFAEEAKLRTELIEADLRNYRSSCSPNQLVEGNKKLSEMLQRLVSQTLQYIRYECEQAILVFEKVNPDTHKKMAEILKKESYDVERNCVTLIAAVVEEVVMAADTEAKAVTKADRPSYVYQNTFQAAVNSVAQGNAVVEHAQQVNYAPPNMAEIINLMNAAVANWSPDERKKSAGAEAALLAEAKADQPDMGLVRPAIEKLANVATTAAGNVATQVFLAYLKAHGWSS